MKIQTYHAPLTIFGLSFLNWTWFFLPRVSCICVIMELLLVVAFLANIAGSGRSPMNLRMITHTTREACSGRKHSQKLPREPVASCSFFLYPVQAAKIPVSSHRLHQKFTFMSNNMRAMFATLSFYRKRMQL